jgi:hypothetical protein
LNVAAIRVAIARLRMVLLEPVGRILEDDIEHDLQADTAGDLQQGVEIREIETVALGVHPGPAGPELDRVHSGIGHQLEIALPV